MPRKSIEDKIADVKKLPWRLVRAAEKLEAKAENLRRLAKSLTDSLGAA